MDRKYNGYAGAAFGLEGLVARELRQLGLADVRAENGGVAFTATGAELFRCNLGLRCCDRVFILLAERECRSFEELFQLVSSVDWAPWFTGPEAVNVSAHCARSTLMSPRDCQAITKKAVIEWGRRRLGLSFFPETGPELPIQVALHNDRARLLLNTSGSSLSRRGYRTWNGEAPLRETLAAALVDLSPWQPGQPLHDPCCGTGTLLIEAALRAAGRLPGQNRSFAMERFSAFQSLNFESLRAEAAARVDLSAIQFISGSDIDPTALELAGRHVAQAGLPKGAIALTQAPLEELTLPGEGGVFLCNPPYGERLSDQQSCRRLYRQLGELQKRHPTWSLCAISSDPAFERSFGRRADRKRRLYNGRLECVYYIYSPR